MNKSPTIKIIDDKDIWDKFIITNNSWSFFQSFNWGQVQLALGNQNVRLGIFENLQLIGVAQVIAVNAKRGKFLHIRHGPVFTKLNYQEQITAWKSLINYLIKMAKQHNAWFLRISPMITDNKENNLLLKQFRFHPSPIQAMDAEIAWVLDLDKSNEELFTNMRKTTRYLIKQAEKLGVVILETNNLTNFFKLYTETYNRQHFVPHQGIQQEFEILKQSKSAFILEAKYQGKVLGAALFIKFGNQMIYHHSASIASKIPANYLLQWQAIKMAKQIGKSIYNFWGIAPNNNPRHPWKGLSQFKQGFGGREVRFMHAHDLPLSPFYRISYTIETVRKIIRGY